MFKRKSFGVSLRPLLEAKLSLASIIATVVSYVLIFSDQSVLLVDKIMARDLPGTVEIGAYSLIICGFAYAILVYHISRFAFYWKASKNKPPSPVIDCAAPLENAPDVTILIPSYCEEVSVIWQTMMSAALVDYPHRRIVLLLDNPPTPSGSAERRLLADTRAQAGLIDAMFRPINERFAAETQALQARFGTSEAENERLFKRVCELYREAARFLESIAERIEEGEFGGPDNHVRRFFIENVLLSPARAHVEHSRQLMEGPKDAQTFEAETRRLSIMFQFDVDVFERKGFVNLTHEPNKAANLNAYIGLLGKRFAVERNGSEQWLVQVEQGVHADVTPPDAEFLVVLDADSFMHPDYLKKTMGEMLAPGNGRVAVSQTPYKAISGSVSLLERTAGASTDVHFCVAEGMSVLNAGSWVGATALVRKAALYDIVELGEERGFHFPVFIPDKTLIEDADATIRLMARGWSVRHLPEQLNWSSTPGDFGSLVIQRRRWANGGLLILPALLRHLKAAPASPALLIEGLLRIYNLLAAPITAIGGLAILIYPFDVSLASRWVSIALIPYLYLHGRDLKRLGYGWMDLFRIFALNIILLPVILVGVLKSVEQAIRGRKIPFARTPKILRRTAVPTLFLLAPLGLLGWSLYCFHQAVALDLRGQAFPSFFCAIALTYAFSEFVGVGAMIFDIAWAIERQVEFAFVSCWRLATRAAVQLRDAVASTSR